LNGGDLAVANGDVFDAIDALGRTDDAAAAQEQVKRGAYRHGRSPLPIAGASSVASQLRSMLRI